MCSVAATTTTTTRPLFLARLQGKNDSNEQTRMCHLQFGITPLLGVEQNWESEINKSVSLQGCCASYCPTDKRSMSRLVMPSG